MICAEVGSAQQAKRAVVPIDPFAAIFDAFRSHAIVALGEGEHNNEPAHRFRLSLLRDPRFALTVNDIVVEFGSARYQALMDRFIQGDNVSARDLRQAWLNTTQLSEVWDVSIYEEFFRSVRAVNATLPEERRLRVLLGDPPVDWNSSVSIRTQTRELGTRDGFAAALVQREVLAKRRRALVIYGDMHFVRTPGGLYNIVERLEDIGARIFTIDTAVGDVDLARLQPDILKWPEPSLALIRGTMLELAPFTSEISSRTTKSLINVDTTNIYGLDGRFDALLYLGHPLTVTFARFSTELCADQDYIRMRSQRKGDTKWESSFKAACKSPQSILPQLWRAYQAKGIASTLTMAPKSAGLYPEGAQELYRFAQAVMKRGKFDDAIAILELNARIFPRDVLSLKALAEAYNAKGDRLGAIRSYQRTLAINRNDQTARTALGLNR